MNLLKTLFILLALIISCAVAYGIGIKSIDLVLDAGQWLLLATLSLTFMHTARI
jgi:hypothetical protein